MLYYAQNDIMDKTEQRRHTMNYNKLIFHEDLWPDVVGRTLVFNCKCYELELKSIEGVRSCSITMAECIAFRSRFDLSHIDTWAEEYHWIFCRYGFRTCSVPRSVSR